jgi:hypothetical protein
VPDRVATFLEMVRTLDAALEYLRTHGIITEVPTGEVPSLAEAVIGAPTTGGVWRHAKGNLVFRLGKGLRASPEVVALRLWQGKMTFVARRLWPEVYRVVMEPARRRAALHGLSPGARALLERVERERDVRLFQHAWEKERETLEERLLVQASDVLIEDRYWTRLQAWRHWAPDNVLEIAGSLSFAEALHGLSSPSGALPVGPWLSTGEVTGGAHASAGD